MKIVAIGRTKLLYDSIKYLYEQGMEVVLIITCREAPEYSVTQEDFKKLAKDIGSDYFCDSYINNKQYIQKVKEYNADIAISVNWINVITREMIDIFPNGILNCHAGDLPRYRGNAVANWAIIMGEKEVVVTIHKMDEGLDTGNIVLQERVEINDSTTIKEIYDKMEDLTPKLFYKSIQGILEKRLIEIKQDQDKSKALRCYPRKPYDSFLDWNQEAVLLERVIRASVPPFGGAYTYFNGQRITVLKAHVEFLETPSIYVNGQVLWIRKEKGEVGIGTSAGVLVIEKISQEGGEEVPATEVIKSLRARLGVHVEDQLYLLNKRIDDLERKIKLCNIDRRGGLE